MIFRAGPSLIDIRVNKWSSCIKTNECPSMCSSLNACAISADPVNEATNWQTSSTVHSSTFSFKSGRNRGTSLCGDTRDDSLGFGEALGVAVGLCLSSEAVATSGLLRITQSRSAVNAWECRFSLPISASFLFSQTSGAGLSSSTFEIRAFVTKLLSSVWPLTTGVFLGDEDLDPRCIANDECETGRPWSPARAAAAAAALAWMKEDWKGMFCVNGLCWVGGVSSL